MDSMQLDNWTQIKSLIFWATKNYNLINKKVLYAIYKKD